MVSGWNKRLGIFHEARIDASWPFAMRIFFDSLITPVSGLKKLQYTRGFPLSSRRPTADYSPRPKMYYLFSRREFLNNSFAIFSWRSFDYYIRNRILPSSRPRNFHSHFRIIDDWSSYIISILDYSFFQSSSIDIIVIIIILHILYYVLYYTIILYRF